MRRSVLKGARDEHERCVESKMHAGSRFVCGSAENVEERLFPMLRSLVAALFLASSAQAAKSLRERLHGSSPCQCQADTSAVARPSRTKPKCIFIDLGAADGNSYNAFLRGEYGQIKDCPNQEYEAYLVEANPFFQKELKNKAAKSAPGKEQGRSKIKPTAAVNSRSLEPRNPSPKPEQAPKPLNLSTLKR